MQMKRMTGDGWESLYPKTIAGNVAMNNGDSVQEEVEKIYQKFPEDIVLWEGSVQLTTDDIVRPSKPLSECARGWVLVWSLPSGGGQFQYQEIPKISLDFVGGAGTRALLAAQGGVLVHKYFYPRDTEIRGHSSNTNGDNDSLVLYRVLEY